MDVLPIAAFEISAEEAGIESGGTPNALHIRVLGANRTATEGRVGPLNMRAGRALLDTALRDTDVPDECMRAIIENERARIRQVECGSAVYKCWVMPRDDGRTATLYLDDITDDVRDADRAKVKYAKALGNMSHELRTPINVLGNALRVMAANRRSVPPRVSEMIRMCERAKTQMSSLVDDLLDSASIDEGTLSVRPKPTNLILLASECVAAVRESSHKRKRINFRMETRRRELDRSLMLDGTRVRQIIVNLLSNAEKFTDDGLVRLTLDLDDDLGHVVCTVADTGRGIRDGADVWRRYQTEDDERRNNAYGRGLGLWLAHHLVTRMGGTVRHERNERDGSGTEFTVSLPVEWAAREDAPADGRRRSSVVPEARRPSEVRNPVSLLVAEDNHDNRITCEALFRSIGVRAFFVVNGRECVDEWKDKHGTGRYDAIFMDCHMPVLDGYAATRELRKWEEETGAAPAFIVAATASVVNGENKCQRCGMDAFLPKPFDFDLIEQVLDYLRRRRDDPALAYSISG
jgi:signal transduction histidine kinase/CheY-like chemotaxis protein